MRNKNYLESGFPYGLSMLEVGLSFEKVMLLTYGQRIVVLGK